MTTRARTAARVVLLLLLCAVGATAAVEPRPSDSAAPPAPPPQAQPLPEKADLHAATLPAAAVAATSPATAPSSAEAGTRPATRPDDPVARIRDEGMNRSQVMQTLSYLTDVIGPRLTGSPNLRRANEWTRERLSGWGLERAHLEPWGPFGRGWSLRRFSAQVIEPQAIPLIAYPKAWSPGFDRPLVASVVYVDARMEGELEKYHGKLHGTIVLAGVPRELAARFEPLALRVTDADLLQLANADAQSLSPPGLARTMTPAERRAMLAGTPAGRLLGRGGVDAAVANPPANVPATEPAAGANPAGPSTAPTSGPTTARARPIPPGRLIAFLMKEGAAALATPSSQGDGGTLFVGGASLPDPSRSGTTQGSGGEASTDAGAPPRDPNSPRGSPPNAGRPWLADSPATLPQITIASEHYNRLVRMLQQGERLTMSLDLQVQYHDDDPMAYNTIAEIPGGDLKDEIVMLGAHLDSWHSGTGATDNGAGCAAVMEAVRILRAAGLQPRRTIRVALWTGEEQGLFGSKAYVTKHFATTEPSPEPTTRPTRRGGGGGSRVRVQPASAASSSAAPTTQPSTGPASTRPARKIIRQEEYDKLSGYFNLDNGTGKIRGVYLQGNEAVRPIFRRWIAPFADLGAATLTLSNTGGTDHTPFDAVGLPGFQFIQDPVEYWSRTHHSNADVFDRAQADDLKQASVILAAFAYDAAMADEKLPRKPPPDAEPRRSSTGP